MRDFLQTWLNRLLVLDVFVVFLGFLWFAVAVVGESTGLSLGYHLWQQLWLPLFNPAIALLIVGALGNWLIVKIGQWWEQRSRKDSP